MRLAVSGAGKGIIYISSSALRALLNSFASADMLPQAFAAALAALPANMNILDNKVLLTQVGRKICIRA